MLGAVRRVHSFFPYNVTDARKKYLSDTFSRTPVFRHPFSYYT